MLGFAFDIETGELTTLVMGALGVPLLGEGVLSTWEMPVEEIVSSGPDRIIVYEGAEDKLKQLSSGVLEKLGVGGPSWEEQERERYRVNLVPVENQLGAGQPVEQEQRRLKASESERFEADEELEYVELEDRRQEMASRRLYLDEPEDRYRPREEPADRYLPPDEQLVDPYGAREEQRYEPEPPPRRVVPASRRPAQQPGEPLDVEPLQREQSEPRREVQESSNDSLNDSFNNTRNNSRDDSLDDPW